jgi:hypothetical protein
MTEDVLTWTATTVVRDNWTDEMLTDHLLIDPSKVTEPGSISASIDQIKQMAASQLMPVSDATAREWATRINSGEMTTDAVASIFSQQAIGEFGWAASSLQAGSTMRDLLMPARDTISRELEMSAETVDFMDPRWRSMVQTAGADGIPRAATLTEVTRAARKDGAWAKTTNAARMAATVAQKLRDTFEG